MPLRWASDGVPLAARRGRRRDGPGPVTAAVVGRRSPRPRPGSAAGPEITCCAGREGRLSAAGHADADGELVLAALGGDKAECVAMLEAWGAHAADLDVLALGPRSPADELAVTWELVDNAARLAWPGGQDPSR